jgi:hypothetical protein
MKKRILVSGGVLLVAAAVLVIAVLSHGHAEPTVLKDVTLKQAKALSIDDAPCAKTNTSVTVSKQDQTNIENSVMGYIIDVPAGTNVDINIAAYDGETASGSAIYEKNYGMYNFTVKKGVVSDVNGQIVSNNNDRPWTVSFYKQCKVS